MAILFFFIICCLMEYELVKEAEKDSLALGCSLTIGLWSVLLSGIGVLSHLINLF